MQEHVDQFIRAAAASCGRAQRRRWRRAASIAAAVALIAAVGATNAAAQATEDEEDENLLRVDRIEMSLYGGYVGGDTYLDLIVPFDDLTNDTGRDDILDFDGNEPDPPVEGPTKKIEPGYAVGGHVAFFLNPNFAMALYGEFGQAEAVFTGNRSIDGDIQPEVTEIDRATMTTWAAGAEVTYHLGNERRTTRRPFVNLGFGGILNQFANTDDVGALFFQAGVGYAFGITERLRGFVGGSIRLYTWETDEVSLDATLLFPSLRAGITYRYIVPDEEPEDGDL
mgnify:FL=1